jgi:hypothetical protein
MKVNKSEASFHVVGSCGEFFFKYFFGDAYFEKTGNLQKKVFF